MHTLLINMVTLISLGARDIWYWLDKNNIWK